VWFVTVAENGEVLHVREATPISPCPASPTQPAEEYRMTATIAPVLLPPECLAEAATVMGRALEDDPLFVYVLSDSERRGSGVRLMMESLLRIGLAQGEVWATPPPITGVAFWLSPAHPMITDEDRDAAGWREVGAAWGSEAFARFKAFTADIGEVAGSLSAEPHW
jgi:hypothetical protein